MTAAGQPTLEEVLDRFEQSVIDTVSTENILAALDEGRAGR